MRRYRCDLFILLLLFLAGLLIGLSTLRSIDSDSSIVASMEYLYGPAVMAATGRGFYQPDTRTSPELRAFLLGQVNWLDTDMLPEVIPEGPVSEVALYHRYLLYAIIPFWWLGGVAWSNLFPLLALLLAWTTVASYALMRLGMGRFLAALMTLVFISSPAMLSMMSQLRDFSKAPFILSLIALLGYLLKHKVSSRQHLYIAALLGLLIGIGMGFRQDVFIFLPPAFVILFLFTKTRPKMSWRRRLTGVVIFGLCFYAVAWPMFARMEGGAQPYHPLVQGFSMKHLSNATLTPSNYEPLASGLDNYVFTMLYDYHHRTRGLPGPDFAFNSTLHEDTARRWLIDMGMQFPADLLIRGYGAVSRTAQYGDAYVPPGLMMAPWVLRTLPSYESFAEHMRLKGVFYAAAALMIIGAYKISLSLVVFVFFFFICGYISLQCEFRHTFHLSFVPFWVVGFLAHALWQVGKKVLWKSGRSSLASDNTRDAFRSRLMRLSVSLLCMVLMLLLPLGVLRFYQDRQVGKLLAAYESPTLAAISVEPYERYNWTVFKEDGATVLDGHESDLEALVATVALLFGEAQAEQYPVWHTNTRYLAAVFDASLPSPGMLVLHQSPISMNNFTHLLSVDHADETAETVTYFFPVYEMVMYDEVNDRKIRNRFEGIAIPTRYAHLFRSLHEVKNTGDFHFLMHVTTPTHGAPRYQRLNLAPAPINYYTTVETVAGMEGWAAFAFRSGNTRLARELYNAILFTVQTYDHQLRLAGKLAETNDLDVAMEMAVYVAEASIEKAPQAAGLLLLLGRAWEEQGAFEKAEVAYATAHQYSPENSHALLFAGDVRFEQGAHEKALEYYREYMMHHPESQEGAGRIHRVLLRDTVQVDVIRLWRNIVERNPEAVLPQFQLGRAFEQADNYEAAAVAYHAAANNSETLGESALYAAIADAAMDRTDSAKAQLRQLFEAMPDLVNEGGRRIIALGHYLSADGRASEAIDLGLFIRAYLDDKQLLLELADMLAGAGDYETAMNIYRRLLKHGALAEDAASRLDGLLLAMDDLQYREETWRNLAHEHADVLFIQAYLARACFDLGDYSAALRTFQRLDTATSLAPEDTIRYAVAEVVAGLTEDGYARFDAWFRAYPESDRSGVAWVVNAIETLIARDAPRAAARLAERLRHVAPKHEEGWLVMGAFVKDTYGNEALLDHYRQGMKATKGAVRIARQIDMLYAQRQDQAGRLEEWKLLEASLPESETVQLHLTLALEAVGRLDEALTKCQKMMDSHSALPVSGIHCGALLARTGRCEEGALLIAEAVARDGALAHFVPTVCIQAGNRCLDNEAFKEAICLFQQALLYQPDDYFAAIGLGTALGRTRQLDKAAELFGSVIRSLGDDDPIGREAVRQWDAVLKVEATEEQRVDAWRDLVMALPDALLPRERFTMALVEAGNWEEARAVCARTPVLKRPALDLACAAILCRAENLETGLRRLDEAFSATGDVSDDIVQMTADTAVYLLDAGYPQAAEQLLLAAEALEPANLWHQVRLGEVFMAQKRYDQALERFRRVLNTVPDSPYTAARMDAVYEATGQSEARVQEWEALVTTHPDSTVLREYLDKALTDMRNWTEGKQVDYE